MKAFAIVFAIIGCCLLGITLGAESATKRPQTSGDKRKCDNPKELNDAEKKCEEEVKAGGPSQVYQRMNTCVLGAIGVMRDGKIIDSAATEFVANSFTGDAQRLEEIRNSMANCLKQTTENAKINCVSKTCRRSCIQDRSLLNTTAQPAGGK